LQGRGKARSKYQGSQSVVTSAVSIEGQAESATDSIRLALMLCNTAASPKLTRFTKDGETGDQYVKGPDHCLSDRLWASTGGTGRQ